ncbi:MAG: hypothetical protein ACI89Z_000538 [Porticoccus sp.]|jgi:uncharacterized protein YhjY with autotransporter beta-barrel domain
MKITIKSLAVNLFAVLAACYAITSSAAPLPTTTTVEYEGTTYNLESFSTSYDEDSTLLEAQPWWGDVELASNLTELVQFDLGGAFFIYGADSPYISVNYWGGANTNCPVCSGPAAYYSYVIATLVQAGYTLEEAYSSVMSTNATIDSALSTTSLLVNGAYSRPMSRRVAKGEKTFWVSGDWGNDDHDSRDGSSGLAEMGFGYNFGPTQINLSLGKTWADQDLIHGGEVDVDGRYLMVESILPVSEEQGLYATLGAYNHWGDVDIRRGYTVGEDTETSTASPDTRTWGLRARLDWENAFSFKSARFSPYTDAMYTKTKLDSYTEKSGSFPAHFDSREDDVTELRIGLNGAVPIRKTAFEFIANIESVRRFDDEGDGASGEIAGLFSFNLEEENYDQNWLKGGFGVEGQFGKGKASLMLNGTTEGEAPSSWLAASYQIVF